MADANVDSVQQSQDAQNLDNLTSLQQADSTTTPQPAGGTADATVTTTNPPAPDTPSLYNEVTGTQNNQPNLEAAGTNSLLDTTTFTNDGRDGTANESPTVGSGGTFGTEVNTGDSQVQYTVTNENPTIQGSGTNGTQNTVGGTQGGVAADGAATTEATTATTDTATAPTDAAITNTTPAPTLNADGTPATDLTIDPLVTDPTPQEPVVMTQDPSLTITKTADVATVDGAGDVISYTITVANTGNQTLTGVVLTDEFASATLFSGDTDADNQLDVGESWTYTASHTVTQDEIDDGLTLTNLAKVDTDQTGEQQDDAQTTITQDPKLTITKTADVAAVDGAGDVITYTITVANAGNQTLTGVVLTDEFATATYVGGDLDADNQLDVGESWTYGASHTVTQAEIDAGTDLTNVASVDTNETTLASDDAVTTITQDPSLTITKTADVATVDGAGDVISYTITVANTGNQTLTGVVLTDEFASATLFSGDTDADNQLDVGESWTYTASHTVTQDEIDDGLTLTNLAKVDTDQTGEQQDDAQTTITQDPKLTITKTADVAAVDGAGDVITYTITVANAGNQTLTGVVLTDEFATATYVGGDLDADNQLDVGESWTYGASHTVTQAEIDAGTDLTNVASVDTNETTLASDDAVTTITQDPSLTITKTADVATVDGAGDVISYTITVANTGNQTLTGVVLTDEFASATLFSGDTDADNQLDVGESWTYTASHTVTQDEIDDGLTLTNLAKVDTDQTGEQQDDAQTTITQDPKLTITKTADVAAVDGAGDVITYTITVANAGNQTLTGVVLTDEFATATYVGGDLDADNQLDVGESWTYGASHTVTQAEIDAGTDLTNVASVDTNETTLASDDAVTTITQDPSLTITKTADVATVDGAGDVISYTITVANTGNQTLTGVVLTDEFASATLFSGDTDADNQLDVGESWTYTASHTVTQDEIDDGLTLTNLAKVDTDQTGEQQDDAQTTITQDPKLTITKTADVAAVDGAGDVITYTITVANAGNQTLTGVVLTDEFATATYVGGDLDADNQLDVGESWTYGASHTVTQAEIDAGTDLTNVASVDTNETTLASDDAVTTITQDPSLTITKTADVATVDGAGDVISYTITVANTGNQTLTGVVLTDEFASATLFSGDTDADNQLDVGESWTYTASHTVTQDEIDDGLTLTNLAKVDTDQTGEQQDDAQTTITQDPKLTITKTADVAAVDGAGDVITYTITVANAGNQTLTGVVLTDEFATATYVGGDLDADNQLDVGESWTYGASHTVTQAEIDAGTDLTNVASVDTNETTLASDDAVTTITQDPSLTITKTADVATVDGAGDVISYTITVANTGNQTLTGVVLTDEFASATLFSGDTDADNQLDVGESWTYTASHTVTQDEIDDGLTLTNLAKVDTDQTGEQQDDAQTTITQDPKLTITKTADVAAVDGAGDVITYTITVANAGNQTLTGVVLTDEFATATYVGGDLDADNQLDVGESWTYGASHTVTQAEIDAGTDLTNVASVDTNETTLASDDAVTTITQLPELTLTKVGTTFNSNNTLDTDGKVDVSGDLIRYEVTVENTGNTTLHDVVVSDPFFESVAAVFVGGSRIDVVDGSITISSIDIGHSALVTYTYQVTDSDISNFGGGIPEGDGTIDNTVTASSSGITAVDSYYVEIVRNDISITKYANVSMVEGAGSQVKYTLTVRNEGGGELTEVRVDDDLFAGSSDTDTLVDGLQLKIDVVSLDIDGHVQHDIRDVTVRTDIDGGSYIDLPNLAVGSYVNINYTYTVTEADAFTEITELTSSVWDNYTPGPIDGSLDIFVSGASIGSLSAFVDNKGASDSPYSHTPDEVAQLYMNVDNTGMAIGVDAGVMNGDRNGATDHLVANFDPTSIVKTMDISFTNAKDVEVAFASNYDGGTFVGSMTISNTGVVVLSKVINGVKTGLSGGEINWMSYTVEDGPGGAQNKIYTLSFNAGDADLNSYDFWVVGNPDPRNLSDTQIKVVDMEFKSQEVLAPTLTNIATVTSAEDVYSGISSDEYDAKSIIILDGITVEAANIASGFNADQFTIKDTYDNLKNISNNVLNKSTKLEVVKLDGSYDSDGANQLVADDPVKFSSKTVTDYVAPATPTIDNVATDNKVNAGEKANLVITGTGEIGALVTLAVANQTAIVGNDGKWSITVADAAATFGQGGETLSVTQSDAAGNVSSAATKSITVDTSPPATPTIDNVATDNKVNAGEKANLVITGTGEIGALVTLAVANQTAIVGNDGKWSITVADAAATFGQGGETLSVTQSDAAGNVSSAATKSITVDTSPPATPTIDNVATDNIVNLSEKNNLIITGTGEIGALVTLAVANQTAIVGNDGKWSITVADAAATFGQGGETLSVTQSDAAGNVSSAATKSITVDTSPPATPTIDNVATDNIVNLSEKNNLIITGTGEIGALVTLAVANQTAIVGNDGKWSITVADAAATFGQGGETLSVTQSDAAGNVSSAATKSITVNAVDSEAAEANNSASIYSLSGASKSIVLLTSSLSFSDANQAAGVAVSYSVKWQTDNAGTWTDAATGTSYAPANWGSNLIRFVITTTDSLNEVTVFTSASFAPNSLNSTSATSPSAVNLTTSATPIAMDLNGDGIHYFDATSGVTHDYNNDGIAESTAWVAPEDGLLAIQKEDGTHNIVFSTQAGETDLQGLGKVYDSNKDGVLDAKDADFAKFGVWQDADSDGVVDSGEYLTLADRGITSLSLTSDGQVHFEANGDVIVYGQTTYTTADGELHIAEDVGFAVSDVYEPLDIAAIIANADAIESVTRIDQLAETDSSSSLMVELGGQTYEIATLLGQEVGTQDILSQFVGNDTSANLLTNKSWTDVIDIASDHGGPGAIIAAGGTLDEGAYANGEGDWTVVINSGDAKVDATNNQITFSSDSAENSVTITTADGSSHNIDNVDKIQWHG